MDDDVDDDDDYENACGGGKRLFGMLEKAEMG
jgi:hypothetical protein